MNELNIILCASDNYTMQCGITICSVCENNKDEHCAFYLFVDKMFTDEHKKQLSDLVRKYPNKRIEFLDVKDEQVDSFLQFENYWWTRHVFYRLLAASLLPASVNKAIYLDCDVIVRHSLQSYWDIDIEGYGVGCVPDAMEGIIEYYNRLEYPSEKHYFNSGVLLLNIKFWRENQSEKSFFEYINNNPEKISAPDQDVLNVVFADSKKLLPLTYNFQSGFLYKKRNCTFEYRKYIDEIRETAKDPIILHLSGVRPWIKQDERHPFESEWFKYKAITMWKDAPYIKKVEPIKKRILESFRPLAYRLGLTTVIFTDRYDRAYTLVNN